MFKKMIYLVCYVLLLDLVLPSLASGGILYETSFDTADAVADWQVVSGTWQLDPVAGTYTSSGDQALLSLYQGRLAGGGKASDLVDYTLIADLENVGVEGALCARYQDSINYYMYRYHFGLEELEIYLMAEYPRATMIASEPFLAADMPEIYTLIFEVEGTTLTGRLLDNGVELASVTVEDDTFASGPGGLRGWGGVLPHHYFALAKGPFWFLCARVPNPADGAIYVLRDVVLSWMPGVYADADNKHDVYFGTGFNDVNDADRTNPLGVLVSQNQAPTSYSPAELLRFGQTYYWRIDEVNAPPDYTIFKGEVWSFTTEPIAYPIENITATASSSNSAVEDPNNTINGSGLDADDLHSMQGTDMWLSSSEPLGAWIEYEFDKVYKLHEMWVWNSNQMVESTVGFGLKDVTIEYSANGTDWIELGDVPEFAQAPGTVGYAHNTTVDLGSIAAKYVRLTANSNWGGIMNQYGLSEVRFLYIPVHATEPNPDSGATDVSIGTIDKPIDVTLSFRAGREAAKHDVYLSSDEQAVIDGTAPVTTEIETSHGPLSLDVGQTYYWRVDEANEAETPATWQGDIWNFATQEYFVLDDFEDYNDIDPPDPGSNRIFEAWPDGFLTPTTNGALVGNDMPPYAEQSIVHGGSQSMPYFYDNNLKFSEATMTLSSQRRDWTKRGIGSLSLWFRGYPASVGSFVETPAGTYTMTASGANIWYASDEFHFAYKTLSGPGSLIAKIESVEQTHSWAKAGVMIRDTLEPGSAHGTMFLMAAQGLAFERRTTASGSTSREQKTGIAAPYWVKIELDIGGAVRASYSADGIAWTELGRDPITMDTPMYIGLALTSHDADLTCQAVFSNVQINGTVSGEWMNQDIGILSNAPEPMYVALANSGGTPAVVYHPDPNATQMGTWTEWNIDLNQFADQGVNLTNVDKLSIGIGDRNNPQPGSSGKMYFDDIRLYRPRPEPEPEP